MGGKGAVNRTPTRQSADVQGVEDRIGGGILDTLFFATSAPELPLVKKQTFERKLVSSAILGRNPRTVRVLPCPPSPVVSLCRGNPFSMAELSSQALTLSWRSCLALRHPKEGVEFNRRSFELRVLDLGRRACSPLSGCLALAKRLNDLFDPPSPHLCTEMIPLSFPGCMGCSRDQ